MRAVQGRKVPSEDNDSEIISLKNELEASLARIGSLERENQGLRHESAHLRAQISSLRAHDNERKSILWKKFQNSRDSNSLDASQQKASVLISRLEDGHDEEKISSSLNFPEFTGKLKPARVPNPLPKVSTVIPNSVKDRKGSNVPSAPPPPPPPSKLIFSSNSVHRVPEVMEFYRSLTRPDARKEHRTNSIGTQALAFTRNMIGEIENRSTYLSAIKSEVETQKELINFLIKEVESAAYTEISDVEAFVKWLDGELSSLVDERAILKHFPQWPEQKADALREAACSYRELRNLESEVSSFKDNPKDSSEITLRRIQALQERLEQSVNSIERTRESLGKKYRDFQIPWKWMHETGLIGKMKLGSLRLATEYMKRISKELQSNKCQREDNFILQGARFAYRIHQFAGGFDAEALNAFKELRKICTVNDK